jgi:hypothetical protein
VDWKHVGKGRIGGWDGMGGGVSQFTLFDIYSFYFVCDCESFFFFFLDVL